MNFIIQVVLLVAICMAGFPGLSANPIENGERAQVTRNEDDDRFCLLLCWKNSNNWSPECRKCASDCETTSCAKTPELDLSETPECQKCSDNCRDNVCKL